ncbi:hypothetical protein OUZ56_007908 [Daphnia magna]|uniref:Uncharacterized protein n=1 Tax=Daphnia magna TaxID=35525 RepID=A0ABR0ABC9_9CRUS|nr:hypothetical protein OUZ56_007908 [Daphnia magna]
MKGDITQKPCGRSWAYVADLNRINSCVVLDETEHKISCSDTDKHIFQWEEEKLRALDGNR